MTDESHPGTHGPLHGLQVLDMTTVQMGPLATAILADLGADVIKIESPEGDISRNSLPTRSPGMGHSFLMINRNKRAITLDLKASEGKSALLALAKKADIFVSNVRPQAMARLKLDYDDLKAVNPKIIYVGAFGFSQRGRYAARPAYDLALQGMAGLPWMSQRASGQAPRYAPHSYVDQTSALHVVIGVLSALHHRSATGRGQRVHVPMFENLVHVLLGEHLAAEAFIPPAGPVGYDKQMTEDRRPYATKDGYICPFIYNDKQWRIFLAAIGQPSKFDEDSRFSSHRNRLANFRFVNGFLSDVLQTRTTEEWKELLTNYDLPFGPMNSLEDVLRDPHLADTNYFRSMNHPTEGPLRYMTYPTEFSETPPSVRRHAPHRGEHTVEVLEEAGYDRQSIDDLVQKGVAITAGHDVGTMVTEGK